MSTGGNGPRPDGAESSGGRGNQTGGRSNGGRGRGGRGKNQGQQSNTRFQGQEPSLKDCVFDYSEDPQSKRYLRNVELLVGYVGTSFDYYNLEYQKALEKLELKDPEKAKVPDDPTDPFSDGRMENGVQGEKGSSEGLSQLSRFLVQCHSRAMHAPHEGQVASQTRI